MQYRTLGGWDYAVICLTLLISLAIGVYFRFSGGKQQTTVEYLLGDRNQRALPVALSLMASLMSAVTLLGVSAEIYMFGTLFLNIIVSYVFFTAVAAYLYLPVFFKLQATSAYEYLELRFGRSVRLAASLVYSMQMLLYMGVVLYAPAIALQSLTGLSRDVSILVVGLVCTIYSTIGGIKAIIWTDFFQSLLMYGALISVIATAAWKAGGVVPIWRIAEHHSRIQYYDFTIDPTQRHTSWTLFFGGGFTFLSLYAVNQTQVQRYLTVKDYRTAMKTLWLSLPFLYLLLIACSFAGLAIFSVYHSCDPLKSGRISSLDQLMPLFVIDTMSSVPGLSGLFAAGIFSASLSTVSACVNSLAAVTVEDYLKPLCHMWAEDKVRSWAVAVKCLALGYGLASVAMAFAAGQFGGLLQAGLSIHGIAGGPLLGTFTLGMFLPTANEQGALAGIVSGLVTALWIGFGQPKPRPARLPLSIAGCPPELLSNITSALPTLVPYPLEEIPYMYRVSYLLYVVISCLVTLLVGITVSQLFNVLSRSQQGPANPDLFSPPVAHYLRRKQRENNVVRTHALEALHEKLKMFKKNDLAKSEEL